MGGRGLPRCSAGLCPPCTTTAALVPDGDMGTPGCQQWVTEGWLRRAALLNRQLQAAEGLRGSALPLCPGPPASPSVLCHAVPCRGAELCQGWPGLSPRGSPVHPVQSSLEGASTRGWGRILTTPWCSLLLPTPGSPQKALAVGAVSSGHMWLPGGRGSCHQHACPAMGKGHRHGWPMDLAPASSRAASATCICLPYVWLRIYFIIWRKAFTANKRAN